MDEVTSTEQGAPLRKRTAEWPLLRDRAVESCKVISHITNKVSLHFISVAFTQDAIFTYTCILSCTKPARKNAAAASSIPTTILCSNLEVTMWS